MIALWRSLRSVKEIKERHQRLQYLFQTLHDDIQGIMAKSKSIPRPSLIHNPDCSMEMALYSGRYIDPQKIHYKDIDIEDIAHALSNLCRFAGHSKFFYSVAQHSYYCAWAVFQQTKDKNLALIALLHDAPEAYIGDLIRCIKHGLPDFCALEERIWCAVLARFDLGKYVDSIELPKVVKEADYRMLVTERLALFNEQKAIWDLQREYEPFDIQIMNWSVGTAKVYFLEAFKLFSNPDSTPSYPW